MQIEYLDHVNIRTTRLDDMAAWYHAVLGLAVGDRPDFPFPGAWLYAGDRAVVHLIGITGDEGVGSEQPLKLEHFAFRASGAAEFEARLKAEGQDYRRVDIPEISTAAFNVWDLDGNHIHVDFSLDD